MLCEGDKIQDLLNEFCDIHQRLAKISIVLPDEMSVIVLLANLPKAYVNFVVAIESRDTLPTLTALKVIVI